MNFLIKTASLIIAFVVAATALSANELATRSEIKDTVMDLFLAEDFAALEDMAEEFRRNDARTSSGLRKLHLFYSGVGDAARFSFRHVYPDAQSTLDIADAWDRAFPQSTTAALAKATVRRKLAWHYRGGGAASSVSRHDHRTFIDQIKIADGFLQEAKARASTDSYYYYLRAHNLNALGADKDVFLTLMDEGLNKFPDAYQLYFAGVDYFAPKWHGSALELEAYARSAIAFAEQTDPDALYARIYWYASQTQYGLYLFADSDVVWNDMRDGINEVLDDFPDQWNIQNFALFACAAHDSEMTRDLLGRIQYPILVRDLRDTDIMSYCQDVAHL